MKGDVIGKENQSIKEIMALIDRNGESIAFLVDEQENFKGLVTDGDIRRAILRGTDISNPISGIMNTDAATGKEGMSYEQLRKLKEKTGGMGKFPILDKDGRVVDMAILPEVGVGDSLYKTSKDKVANGVKRVLIIGGAGYLGSVLTRKLLDRGYDVRVFDSLLYTDKGIDDLKGKKGFEFVEGDIRNLDEVVRAVIGCHAVIHLAAIVGDPASSLDPVTTIEINYLSTKIAAEVCKHHQVNRFVFASTCSVYGQGTDVLDETAPLNPVSLYARSKIESEKGILSIMDDNFSPTILRLSTLYGASPRMRFDLVVNTMTAKALKEREITVFGGGQWRPLVHVSDAAEAFARCLEAPLDKVRGEVFNVGSTKQNYQIVKLAEAIHKEIPESNITVKEQEEDLRDYNVSFEKIEKAIGFEPGKTVEIAVKEIKDLFESGKIKDYKDNVYYNIEALDNKKT